MQAWLRKGGVGRCRKRFQRMLAPEVTIPISTGPSHIILLGLTLVFRSCELFAFPSGQVLSLSRD